MAEKFKWLTLHLDSYMREIGMSEDWEIYKVGSFTENSLNHVIQGVQAVIVAIQGKNPEEDQSKPENVSLIPFYMK